MQIRGFPPIAVPDAEILILGSMPGIASLEAGQYYAHPRNAFWPIMCVLFRACPDLSYSDRVRVLARRKVAVWDVLQLCQREGSLDAAIRDEVPNDFATFFAAHPNIRRIGLNGGKAAASFQRHAALHQPASAEAVVLPSTSPAYASLNLEAKCALWWEALMT